MSDFFQLTKSIRITRNVPVDGDRYIVGTLTQRNDLLSQERSFEGLQVYVSADTSYSGLWLLTGTTNNDWKRIDSSQINIVSNNNDIIFNSGGTLVGNNKIIYDHQNSIFKVSDNKSEFLISSYSFFEPTIQLKSNYIDGIDISVSNTNPQFSGFLETCKSLGTQSNKSNISTATLFTYSHNGYWDQAENSAVTSAEIQIDAINWSNNSYATEYKISTISSGNSSLEERFKITKNGEINFNNAYTFPIESGTTNQVLMQSGNSNLYWGDVSNSLSGLTDTIITTPQQGDKLIYSGVSWVNVNDADTIYIENIGSGGTYEFVVGDKNETNAIFIHFMNYQNNVFQMGELQLLHDGTDAQVTTNGQDLNLYVTYSAKIVSNDIVLVCDIPSGLSGDVLMKYTLEIF